MSKRIKKSDIRGVLKLAFLKLNATLPKSICHVCHRTNFTVYQFVIGLWMEDQSISLLHDLVIVPKICDECDIKIARREFNQEIDDFMQSIYTTFYQIFPITAILEYQYITQGYDSKKIENDIQKMLCNLLLNEKSNTL